MPKQLGCSPKRSRAPSCGFGLPGHSSGKATHLRVSLAVSPETATRREGLTRSNGWGLSLLGGQWQQMRRSLRILVLLAVAIGATACESFDVLGPQRSAALLYKIRVGMSQAEVIDQLGKPQKEEAQGATQFLFYQTAWQIADQAKQRIPIAIRDGKVVGLGNVYLKNHSNPANPWTSWVIQVSSESTKRSGQAR
jgi:hypothetical protein